MLPLQLGLLPWEQSFRHYFACRFHLILTNNSLTIAHLTIQHHCFNKSVLIFVMLQFLLNQLFTFRVFPSLNLYISDTKKTLGTLSKLARRRSTSKFLFRRTKAKWIQSALDINHSKLNGDLNATATASVCLKAISHSTIFDIPMRPVREDQRHRWRFTRYVTSVMVIIPLNFASCMLPTHKNSKMKSSLEVIFH